MRYKYRLLTPGPTPIPPEVLQALAQPMVHHRTADFEQLLAQCRAKLRWLFQTQQEVLILSGTGTAAMDAAVCNFLSPNDVALFVNAGKFGERWGKILQAYGCQAVPIEVPWGHSVTVKQVALALEQHPQAKAVYLQACETSTTVLHPVADIAALCKSRPQTLCIVDAITAVGVHDIAMDRDHIDVLLTGSQKALMLPPGLAFIGVSEKGWRQAAQSRLPKFYLDLTREKKAAAVNQTAFTSSVSLITALAVALEMMQQEGLDALFARHRAAAQKMQEGLVRLGCQLYAQSPSCGVTAFLPPSPIEARRLIQTLRDTYNITVGGGQEQIKGKVVRVAHMGYFDLLDIDLILQALHNAMAQLS